METTTLRFDRGALGAAKLNPALKDLLTELAAPDSQLRKAFEAAGLPPDQLGEIEIEAAEEEQGIEPVSAIAIAIGARIGGEVVIRLWDGVIWPELKRRLGSDALGDRRPPEDED